MRSFAEGPGGSRPPRPPQAPEEAAFAPKTNPVPDGMENARAYLQETAGGSERERAEPLGCAWFVGQSSWASEEQVSEKSGQEACVRKRSGFC